MVDLLKSAFSKLVLSVFILVRAAPLKFASLKLALEKTVFSISAPLKFAPESSASEKSELIIVVRERRPISI